MKCQLTIYTYKTKLNRLFKLILIMMFHINPVFSQDYSGYYYDKDEDYDEESYDRYYNVNNKYQRAIDKEDLYNGGYNKRKQLNNDEVPTPGYFRLGIDINNLNKKSRFETSNKNEITIPDKNYNRFGFDTREASLQDDNDVMSDDAKNGVVKINNHNMPYQLEDDNRITEGAPPPPDTPDVPIKSAWAMTLTIGAFFLYIKIKSKS